MTRTYDRDVADARRHGEAARRRYGEALVQGAPVDDRIELPVDDLETLREKWSNSTRFKHTMQAWAEELELRGSITDAERWRLTETAGCRRVNRSDAPMMCAVIMLMLDREFIDVQPEDGHRYREKADWQALVEHIGGQFGNNCGMAGSKAFFDDVFRASMRLDPMDAVDVETGVRRLGPQQTGDAVVDLAADGLRELMHTRTRPMVMATFEADLMDYIADVCGDLGQAPVALHAFAATRRITSVKQARVVIEAAEHIARRCERTSPTPERAQAWRRLAKGVAKAFPEA